jgi:Zn-dependent protease
MPPLTPELVALGFVWYIVFVFSTSCHEAAHTLAAKLGGDPTAASGGQATLNPFPHIRREPIGMVVIPLLSYLLAQWMMGWASAPYDPNWQRRYPHRAGWMALAGPGANFALMFLAGLAIRAGVAAGYFAPPASASFSNVVSFTATGSANFLTTALSILFVLNLLLGTFNLLPVPPLDGSTAITLLMPEGRALSYLDWLRASGFGMLGLLIAMLLFSKVSSFVFDLALNLLYPGAHYA